MTKAATRSIGTSIQIGLNVIAELTSIGSPSITVEELDVTTLDSIGGYREFISGFKDPGELTLSGYAKTSDAGQAAVYAALESGETQSFVITYPPKLGATWSFEGIVTAYSITTELEDALGFEATIRVSGKPTLSMTASAGLSALSLTGTGGTLAPTFANNKYYYTYSGVSATSVTVTATATSHTLTLYVDGIRTADLTSGVASSGITLALNTAKKLTIVAQEAGKSQVIYEVVCLKTT